MTPPLEERDPVGRLSRATASPRGFAGTLLARASALVLAAAAALAGAARLDAQDAGGRMSRSGFAGTVRIDDRTTTITQGVVEVPVLVRLSSGSGPQSPPQPTGLQFVIDYDEQVLGYAWFRSAGPQWTVEKAAPYGNRRMTFTLERDVNQYAGGGGEAETAVLIAVFYVKDPPEGELPFRHRVPITLGMASEGASPFTQLFADTAPGVRVPLRTWSIPGSATVYYFNGVEVGGGGMTPAEQDIRLPLYLTDILGGRKTYSIGIDYDEIFLSSRGVVPLSPPLAEGELVQELAPEGGRFTLRVSLASAPEEGFSHLHVADLLFRYSGKDPFETELLVEPRILEDAARAEVDGGGDNGGQAAQSAGSEPGRISILPARFTRGNVDGSYGVDAAGAPTSTVDTTDVLLLLKATFGGEASLPCLDAADVNDSGRLELSDAVLLLNHLFRGGPAPPMPFPGAGVDPTANDALDCGASLPAFEPERGRP